jgi:hypothetical protein
MAAAGGRLSPTMEPEEYERRRRALEAQLQADLELVQAGHEAKLRALEALRRTAASEATTPVPSYGGDPRQVAAPEVRPPATARVPSPPPAPVRRPGNEALFSLEKMLSGLPAVFDKSDVIRALGYTPSRGTLGRAITRLLVEERIRIAEHSLGGKLTRYEKV